LVPLILMCKWLWYKKIKITLQDISLTKTRRAQGGAFEEVLVGKLIAVPTNTSNEESTNTSNEKSEVEFEEDPTQALKENP
jgi:hypothetical protein